MTFKALRMGPIARISLGVVALLVSLVLLLDMLFGVVPGHGEQQRKLRQRVAENLAVQITSLLEAGDTATLSRTIAQMLARDTDLRSIVVRRVDGSTYWQKGDDARAGGPSAATPTAAAASTLDDLRVPILSGARSWGEVHLRFVPAAPESLLDWLASPMMHALLLLSVGGFALSYAYMRRAMHYLNPSATVPERVRKAFDALTEGLVIVDAQARIVLANQAFRNLHPLAAADLNGHRIDTQAWLTVGVPSEGVMPWTRTLSGDGAVAGFELDLLQPDRAPVRLLVSSAPVADARGRVRGCMITFDDVTAVHRANEELRATMAELQKSRGRIEEQNVELRRLAERDPLTGCYNRRAFYQAAQEMFARAKEEHRDLCCVMSDIDHFKKFNDVYGHAVGDQVIQIVAKMLGAGLRPGDMLCRYGGEEFCMVLPGATPDVAQQVADALRMTIHDQARDAIRGTDVMRIAASFGVASVMMGASSLESLIEQADQALYKSKEAGRNRVSVWRPEAELETT